MELARRHPGPHLGPPSTFFHGERRAWSPVRIIAPKPSMSLEVGSRLGYYDVTALIGEGGMGQVYQANRYEP